MILEESWRIKARIGDQNMGNAMVAHEVLEKLLNIMDYGPTGENKHNFHKLKAFERDEVAKSIRIVFSESMGNMIRYEIDFSGAAGLLFRILI